MAYAIAAGNAVVLKPSEIAGYTSNCLRILFNKYMDSRTFILKQRILSSNLGKIVSCQSNHQTTFWYNLLYRINCNRQISRYGGS